MSKGAPFLPNARAVPSFKRKVFSDEFTRIGDRFFSVCISVTCRKLVLTGLDGSLASFRVLLLYSVADGSATRLRWYL